MKNKICLWCDDPFEGEPEENFICNECQSIIMERLRELECEDDE